MDNGFYNDQCAPDDESQYTQQYGQDAQGYQYDGTSYDAPYDQSQYGQGGYTQAPYQQGYYGNGYQQGYQQSGYGQPFPQPYTADGKPIPVKSRIAAGLLHILLGDIGVGNFYMGKIGLGILDIVFCWTGVPAIFGLVRGIIILTQSPAEFARKYNVIPQD